MTIRPLSREEVRGIDVRAARELGMPTLILMENAGRGAAAWLRDRGVATSAGGRSGAAAGGSPPIWESNAGVCGWEARPPGRGFE